MKTLRVKLSLSYIFITIICVILISVLSNSLLNQQFKSFVIQQQEKENKSLVNDVNSQFAVNGKWNIDMINQLGLKAIDEGLFITIKDLSGNVVWDAAAYNYDKCEIVKKRLTKNMLSRYPEWKGMYKKDNYDVVFSSNKVGSVEIGYFGPFYYTDNEMLYLDMLNKIVIGVTNSLIKFA